MEVVDIANYEPELKDSPSEAKQIFAAEISMLQWLLRGYRGYNVDKLPDDFREHAYYNAALWRLVIDDLFPHLRDPRLYHILYAKYLILHLREHRFVPGDERGVITRSEVQARLYHRCKRYKARQAVKRLAAPSGRDQGGRPGPRAGDVWQKTTRDYEGHSSESTQARESSQGVVAGSV